MSSPRCGSANAARKIVQDARTIAHIGERGRGLREAREIGVAADFDCRPGSAFIAACSVSGVITLPPVPKW